MVDFVSLQDDKSMARVAQATVQNEAVPVIGLDEWTKRIADIIVANRVVLVVLTVGFFSSVLVAICAISSGSLWIDEFGTWLLTRADSIPDWWRRFQSWPDSDSQIPLYHFFMYVWTKVVGTDAVAMRASNVGMFVIANLALLWPFRSRPIIAYPLILTSCLSSPIWYYLNEIRPYIMLYMGTCLMVGATIEMLGSQQKPSSLGIKALCVGAVLSSGATVIGIAWAASVILFILIYWLAIKQNSLSDLVNTNYFTIAIAVLCITALIAHDIRMFALGKLPALYGSNILTLLFSFYTNLGLLGVGPGMLDMRANGADALVSFFPIIAFAAILFSLVAIGGLLEIRIMLGIRTTGFLIVCILLPVLFIFALGLFLHWRVLPRHFIPLVSLFSILYAFGLSWWWRRRFAGKAVTLISVIIMGYSSLSVRYAPRHAKDDYKHAAELSATELARDGRVWWIADIRGALYYGIPCASGELGSPHAKHIPGVQINISEKTFSFLSTQDPPTLVVLSKPDTYDRQDVVSNYLSVNKYHLVESFPAFTAWRR
jgi:hypothetical protein